MLLKQQRQLMATGLVTQEQISDAMQGNGGKKEGLLLSFLAQDGGNYCLVKQHLDAASIVSTVKALVRPLLVQERGIAAKTDKPSIH